MLPTLLIAICALCAIPSVAQEPVACGAGSYASYMPWRFSRTARHGGDQSRLMQTRPLFLSHEMEERVKNGAPLPTNDWWTHALVDRWTGNLWSYPAKVRIDAQGVRIAFPSFWSDDGTELKERSAVLVSGGDGFSPASADVAGWHDWDVEIELRDGDRLLRATLVHGSPFTWVECRGFAPRIDFEGAEPATVEARGDGRLARVGDDCYGIWGDGESFVAVALLPSAEAFDALAPYAFAIPRSTTVSWRYDESAATLRTAWEVETEDLRGREPRPVALQGFGPHHLKRTSPGFQTMDGLVWPTPRGPHRVAAGNSLSIGYAFPGMLPYWPSPENGAPSPAVPGKAAYDGALFRELVADYAARGSFGGDTYWGGKGLLQMAFAMMAARELGDKVSFRQAHARLRAVFEDWLTWDPEEQRFFFAYVPKWGGLVGQGTSYDSETFNDHHFHYGYFTYAGALLCLVDDDFREKFGPMLSLVARDYANWDRADSRFPFLRTLDPWAGHSFAGGMGDGNGNGQESSSEAMQGWGGLYLLGLALGDDAMRDAGIFGYAVEARATAEYWFDRDRENIDYARFSHPYNSNLTCHGVGWWTFFSGDPVWMHAIQWLPNTPALDYLSEDLRFAKWDWETMWAAKEIGGWFEKGRDRSGRETPAVGGESLGNVLLSYLQRHDPVQAAEVFAELRERRFASATAPDTAHMTYWAIHAHLARGTPDFAVRADFPCARAYMRPDGARTLAAYNPGDAPRTVCFFDAASGATVGELVAAPRCLTVQGERPAALRAAPPPSDAARPARIPKGVSMPDLAQDADVEVSSVESSALDGANLVDGDDATRWSSAHDDPEATATIDLGEPVELYATELHWEAAFAARFLLERSLDGVNWEVLGGERTGAAGLQTIGFDGEPARFVRLRALEKATRYGVSLFSWRIFGRPQSAKNGAPLGLAIETERTVPKQGRPCAIRARAWLGGDRFTVADARWTSADGNFAPLSDGADGWTTAFTPSTDGHATVTATVGFLSVSRHLPVEESEDQIDLFTAD